MTESRRVPSGIEPPRAAGHIRLNNPLACVYPTLAVSLSLPRWYKGFTLTPRTFQVRSTGQWTLDVTIGRSGSLRAFSGHETFQSERDAVQACWRMGCRIIDANPPDCRVSDLASD